MKALEITGQIDAHGRLVLEHLPLASGQIKVILLFPEEKNEEIDPDNEPTHEVLAGLQRAFEEVKAGQRIPIDQIWAELDEE